MSALTAVVTVDATALAAAGQVYDHIDVTVTDAKGAVQSASINGVDVLTTSFVVIEVGDGSYVVGARDAANALMGTELTGAFTIPPQGTGTGGTFPQPSTVTFTVA
jgi:hypothetical protein